MTITINPDATFSTGEVARMLNIEGLTSGRIMRFCETNRIPCSRTEGNNAERRYGHWRIRFADFGAVLRAHEAAPLPGRNRNGSLSTTARVTALENAVQTLQERCQTLELRADHLAEAFDLATAPESEVASYSPSR